MKRFYSFLMSAALLLALPGCRSRNESAATLPATTTSPEASTQSVMSYIEVSREGEISRIPVEIVRGTVGDYTIAMDPEYFTFSAHETVDLFLYESWEGDQVVAYSVSDYWDDADPQEFIDSAIAQFGHLYESYSTEVTTIGGFEATGVYFSNLEESPAYQMQAFLVNCHGNYYLIEATFTFEMYEGLYAIMRALFDTLTPIG